MRQVVFKKFIVFSVDNGKHTRANRSHFKQTAFYGLCTPVSGQYKGTPEESYFIELDGKTDSDIISSVDHYMRLYNQECYLLRDQDNYGYLHYTLGGKVECIGQALEDKMHESEDFTLLPNGKRLVFRL